MRKRDNQTERCTDRERWGCVCVWGGGVGGRDVVPNFLAVFVPRAVSIDEY